MRTILLAAVAVLAFIAPAKAQQAAYSTSISGTISTTNTFQIIQLATRPSAGEARHGCVIQNLGANNMFVNFGAAAVTTPNSIKLTPSSTVRCDSSGIILQDQLAITGTAGDQWIAVIQ